ncbi:MAG: hypothetical protein IH845_04105, partial [Nanoarchaeota archaeon]|nr:hypothetical protein [Nanoarchaeota archaeon]
MSYKRVVKKKGKSYGPYIYESYRDENGKVKKRYLGKAIEPKKNIVSLKFLVGFLGVLFLIGAGYTTNYFVENWTDDVKFKDFVTGFVFEEKIVEGIGEEAKEKAETAKEEAEAVTGAAKESSGSGGPSTATEKVVPEGVFGDMNGAEVDLSVAESGEEITGNETTTEDIENETTDGIEAITGNETTNDTEDAIFPDIPTIDINETLVNETNETLDFNETAENLTFVNETTTLENLTDTNITIEDLNITNVTVLNETLLNETNETVSNISIENITTLQYKAVIGRPVKWIKKINVTNISSGLNIELPSGAENISILTDEEIVIAESEIEEYEDLIEAIGREEIAAGLLTGDVVYDLKSNGGFITRFWNFIKSFGITGNVILIEEDSEKITRTENSTVINLNLTEIIVGETEIALEYYTEAPVANETKTPVGKRIIVHAPDELNYTEILAYTLVDEYNISMNRSDIALYWYAPLEDVSSEDILEDILGIVEEVTLLDSINDSFIDEISLERLNISDGENVTGVIEEVAGGENSSDDEIVVGEDIGSNETDESFNILLTGQVVLDDLDGGDFFDETLEGEVALRLSGDKSGLVKKRIEFVSYDFDGDGIMDYIEWVVPHLSAQTYEFVVTDVSDEKIFLYEDVVPENNFTHLNISDVSPYDSLMLYLPFDTNTSANIAYDYTENNNDMNIYNGSEFVSAGKIGGAFNFDGVDDYSVIDNSPELEGMVTDFTLSLWVKPDFDSTTSDNHVPIDKYDGIGGWKLLFRQNTDVFSFRFRNSGVNQQCEVTSAMTFNAGTWIHIIGTWDGTYSAIYIDGVLNNTCLLTGPM